MSAFHWSLCCECTRNQTRDTPTTGGWSPPIRAAPYRGIYVLYDDHGARYVGLARGQDIGSAFANTRQTIWIESGSGSRGSGCKTVLASRDQQSFQQPG